MWFDALADVMWGSQCPVCGASRAGVCVPCRPPMMVRQFNITDRLVSLALIEKPVAACEYNSSFRFILSAIKEHGRHDLVPIVKDMIVAAFLNMRQVPPEAVAVAIPSRWSVRYKRGLSLPDELATALPIPVMNLLTYARVVRDQAGLKANDRQVNMAGAFRTKSSQSQTVVIVDDVCTTGATLHAAVAALVGSGHRVHSAVFAATTSL